MRYVDGLRAIAVLAVVAHHVVKYSHSSAANLADRILLQGHHGVELFFVISGFCLSWPVLARVQAAGAAPFDVVLYAAKRLVRILPPFYIALAVFTLAGFERVPLHDVVLQALFVDKGTHLLNPSFWSLPVEFRWYLLFPLVLLLWVRSARAFLCLLVLLFVLEQTRAMSTDLAALPAFMLGIVAAGVHVRGWKAWPALPLFAVAALFAFAQTSSSDSGQDTSALWETAMFLLVVAAGAVPFLRSLLSAAPIVLAGAASYSIYLFHDLGIGYAEQWHWGRWGAGAAGVGIGLVMWMLAERPLLQPRARAVVIAPLARVLRRCFTAAGVSQSMQLRADGASKGSEPRLPLRDVPAMPWLAESASLLAVDHPGERR